MRIQHNIMSMNAYRNYTNNTSAMQKNLERLSSGYKINRAGDDAAGLAISEKMRAQITGLETAQKNAKDGISLVQTAEGALTEVHDMLNRMVELATQSANGTYHNDTDRVQLQKEVDQLKDEIDRIADSANFNGIQLLDGSMSIADAKAAWTETKNVDGMDRILKSILGDGQAYEANNVQTVLDSYAGAAAKGAFIIDFKTLDFNVKYVGTGSTISSASASIEMIGSFKVKIGDMEVELVASDFASDAISGITIATDGTITNIGVATVGAAIAQAILNKLSGTASASSAIATINGVTWNVGASNGQLTFTQINDPLTNSEAVTDFDVYIEHEAAASGSIFSITLGGRLQDGTKTKTAGVAKGATRGAETVFELKADDIKDGTVIKLGNKNITLAVGKDSTVAASASNRVDLTAYEAGDADILRLALSAIGATVKGTTTFTAATKGGGKVDIKFNVTVTDNGISVIRQTPPTKNTASAPAASPQFTTLEALAKNFSIKVLEKHEAKDATTGLTLQIGDTAEEFNQLVVSIEDCHAAAIGVGSVDISSQTGAAEAVDKIKDAINKVSDVRGTLGATQNRLDHTINNLSVMTENIQDAESTIRDTDIAEEMMAYTKNNILIQAAQAMLAQANQVPQGVLQLLQ